MSEIHIRKATEADAEQLADLAHELNLFHQDDTRPDPALLSEHHDRFEAYVAESLDGTLVGYVAGYTTFQFHTATPGFEIQNISVKEKRRRVGIGRMLMEAVIWEKYRAGIRKFTLGVENEKLAARAFYQSLGFVERDFGNSKRCYLRDDDLERFMERHIPNSPT